MSPIIRPIESSDDESIEQLIRDVLIEFGANRPGFAWVDPELTAMFKAYSQTGTIYYVIQQGEQLLGGGGIGPYTSEQPSNPELQGVCELQKMYLHKDARGRGLGSKLIKILLEDARLLGYKRCYLETLSTMTGAQRLYQQQGFNRLSAPIAPSIHDSCDCWMIYKL